MNRQWILAGFCVLILAVVTMPAGAQEDAARLTEDVAGLNRSLERMSRRGAWRRWSRSCAAPSGR